MKPLDSFLPYMLAFTPGCPTPTAYQALRSAAREFCERTNVLQVTYTEAAVAGQDEYMLAQAPYQEPVRLLEAYYGKYKLSNVSADHIKDADALAGAAQRPDIADGAPRYAFLRGCNVAVYPVPDAPVSDDGFLFKVALAPTRDATQLPDVLFHNWADEISMGAVARLQAVPGQSFSADPTYATVQFLQGISRAKIEARKGRILAPTRVIGPSFVR